ncbi:unnamed protein product [Fusarium graminearum]|nr:unnamed protein product [Fusarium graminearum]
MHQEVMRAKLTLELHNICTLPQIPHCNSPILTSRAYKRSIAVKHTQRRQVTVLSWETALRTS